jgi:hypothetical protein
MLKNIIKLESNSLKLNNLQMWLSVDPMSEKFPSMSPYNYCANNPVMLVDPDGRIIIPAASFRGTNFEKVFNYLSTNNSNYSTNMAVFLDQNNSNYKLTLTTAPTLANNAGGICINTWGPVTTTGSVNIYPGIKYSQTSGQSKHTYLARNGTGALTLYHFYIVIHESGHTFEIFYPKFYSNVVGHSRYVHAKDRIISIWNELNSDMNLNLSPTQIYEIYLHGAYDSQEYRAYINGLRSDSGRTYDQEVEVFEARVNDILNRPVVIE